MRQKRLGGVAKGLLSEKGGDIDIEALIEAIETL